MDEGLSLLMAMGLLYLLLFIGAVYLIRSIFMLPAILDQLRNQTEYLKDIAVTQRVLLNKQAKDEKEKP